MKSSPVLFLGLSAVVSLAQSIRPTASTPNSGLLVANYGKLPLAFESNQGQTDQQVKFLSRGAGYSLFLTPTEAVLALNEGPQQAPAARVADGPVSTGTEAMQLQAAKTPIVRNKRSAVLRMKLIGTKARPEVRGQDELLGKSNYFIGNDPRKWHTDVLQFAKVRYMSVYPGVDLMFYGNQGELEYDFIFQPGAKPEAVRLGIEGAKRLQLKHGELVITTPGGDLRLRSPRVYQEMNGIRHEVRGQYVMRSKNEVGFEVAAYDRRTALVIDPVLAYSTYLGGRSYEESLAIAVDVAGNAYVTGYTFSVDFPSVSAVQANLGGRSDAFVTKLNADGSAVLYSTYLGGSDADFGDGIAVDSSGNVYVCGYTYSTDFPTANAFQSNNAGSDDGFVTKINADGNSLVYSTYLGGTDADSINAIAVDSTGRVYVTGLTQSGDFPTLKAIQSNYGGIGDAFVTVFKLDGSALVYSTYLGGRDLEAGMGIAVDSRGDAFVTGKTYSTDFPTKNAFQPNNSGESDAFVTKINAGGGLGYSTYLGGSGNENSSVLFGGPIAVDSTGNAYVTGWTTSTDFPTKNALQTTFGGVSDAFVAKIDAAGSAMVYSTYLGGSDGDAAYAIAVDTSGDVYVSGATGSADFPIANAFQTTIRGGSDAFVTEVNSAGSALVYSTFFGGKHDDSARGLALDAARSVFITGDTGDAKGAAFPTTPLSFQQSYGGGGDGFVAKIAQQTFISVSSRVLTFGDQVIGTTSKAKKLKVTNMGASTLAINMIYIAGPNAHDFGQTNTCSSSLAAGASCTISVTFAPIVENKRKAVLGISSSDPASPDAIALSGSGTVVSLSPSTLSFGNQPVSTHSTPQNVTLKNTGNTQLNFAGISITGTNTGDFSQTNTCGISIASGASCTITVTFTPTAIGKRTAALSISDDGGGSPQKMTLSGNGT
jgi:hypothetical protein